LPPEYEDLRYSIFLASLELYKNENVTEEQGCLPIALLARDRAKAIIKSLPPDAFITTDLMYNLMLGR
jgi:hypothetical protein